MKSHCNYIDYRLTGRFSRMAMDYLDEDAQLKPFYNYSVDMEGIKASIAERRQYPTPRALLKNCLEAGYQSIKLSSSQQENLNSLTDVNTFTVTTAHQPNIFLGPLYYIYKTIHAIRLSNELNSAIGNCHFVPVFYMGSEDADLDELGHISLQGRQLRWETSQSGAVGRMLIDSDFLHLISTMEGELCALPYGQKLISLFKECYLLGRNLQDATRELLMRLFADYGLLVLMPDDPMLKSVFSPVVIKELECSFSSKAIEGTLSDLSKYYPIQAHGRPINLFYLIGDRRERIEKDSNGIFRVHALGLHFQKEEIRKELQDHPERFSPNVILRGLFQEMVLPNIAYIGGGGELAYWLELSALFKAAGVPYPMLILRNSFLLLKDDQQRLKKHLSLSDEDLFLSTDQLLKNRVMDREGDSLSLKRYQEQFKEIYKALALDAGAVDPTLAYTAASYEKKALNNLIELEKKMYRNRKRHYQDEQRQISKLNASLFPHGALQERVENFSWYYAKFGNKLLEALQASSSGLGKSFGILEL